MIIFLYTYSLKKKEDAALMSKLESSIKSQGSKVISNNDPCYVYLRKMMILRREMRYIRIEIFIYSCRLVMLVSGLKLVGHHLFDPIFVSICAFAQSICAIFKSMKSKKNFYKLEIEDLKQNDETK